MLLQLGCELAQGYGIARPMPAADFPAWAATWQPDPTWTDQFSVSRDDLPLLYAKVEHRAWIAAFDSYLRDERQTTPPLDVDVCRFGSWLDREGLARHGQRPVFHSIELLHRQIHELGTAMFELHAKGLKLEALDRLIELHELRDNICAQLTMLIQKE
jgi:hypothetical protein